MKFKRPAKAYRKDARGTVVVTIVLRDYTRKSAVNVPGNMIRAFTVHNAKVSEVARLIDKRLFDEE